VYATYAYVCMHGTFIVLLKHTSYRQPNSGGKDLYIQMNKTQRQNLQVPWFPGNILDNVCSREYWYSPYSQELAEEPIPTCELSLTASAFHASGNRM
jgi:hypothetical protein